MRLTRPRGIVCVVTDRRRLSPGAPDEALRSAVREQALAAAAGGVDLFQVREPDLPVGELCVLVRDVVAAVAGSSLSVLVNDRLDVAIAAGAHGVHVRGRGIRPSEIRDGWHGELLIGQSIHAGDAADGAADVALFGTVFPSASKPEGHPVAGVDALADASRRSRSPVLAIGGIDASHLSRVAPVCSGVAAIGWFATCDVRRMSELVRLVRDTFDTIHPAI